MTNQKHLKGHKNDNIKRRCEGSRCIHSNRFLRTERKESSPSGNLYKDNGRCGEAEIYSELFCQKSEKKSQQYGKRAASGNEKPVLLRAL